MYICIVHLKDESGKCAPDILFYTLRNMTKKDVLTAFIVDDEPAALNTLAEDLKQMPEFGDVHTFSNYTEAMLPLLEIQPDVLFLDVEVPGHSGLDFLDSIHSKINFKFHVVFYSAFSHYMLDAIRQSAFDFLLKPYKRDELQTIVNRIVENHNEPEGSIGALQTVDVRKLAIQTVSELLLVKPEQMLMFNYASAQRSWVLTLTDSTTHVLRKSVSADDILSMDSSLTRVSNTGIININYLAAIENNSQRCRFCPPFDELQMTASRRYFSKLKERLDLL